SPRQRGVIPDKSFKPRVFPCKNTVAVGSAVVEMSMCIDDCCPAGERASCHDRTASPSRQQNRKLQNIGLGRAAFRRCPSVVETGAADILLRLLYYGLRQLLQTLTGPHSVKLYLRCALDVIEPVVCVGNRLTYRGNAVVGHEQHRFIAKDLGKALAFLAIKGW